MQFLPAGSLIQADDTWLLWAVILSGVALSIWLEQTYSWAAKVSGPVLALCIAMVLANLHLMPMASPVYDVIGDRLVPLALPLLLFRANVFHIIRTTGWLFLAFQIAAVGTVVGAVVASLTMARLIPSVSEVAGIMTASYIGGGINFFAVANSYHTDSNLVNPLLVADNFIMAGMFLVLFLICRSAWFRRHYPHPDSADATDSRQLAAEHWRRKEISLLDIAACLAVSVTVVAIAELSANGVLRGFAAASIQLPALLELLSNRFVHITLWSTLAATVFHRQLERLSGAEEMGAYLLYIFLFAIGLPADIVQVFATVPLMFVYCLVIALFNLVITFAVGKLFRLNLEHLALAVNATLGGPPTAAAMAISMGWSRLVLPALLIGIWGYAIGTAAGLAVGQLVAGLVE
jgi:uncharacterized membrane protein